MNSKAFFISSFFFPPFLYFSSIYLCYLCHSLTVVSSSNWNYVSSELYGKLRETRNCECAVKNLSEEGGNVRLYIMITYVLGCGYKIGLWDELYSYVERWQKICRETFENSTANCWLPR